MDSTSDELLYDIPFFVKVYKDGRLQRLAGTDVVPAGTDPSTGVHSKDVAISPDINLSARIYIPKSANPGQKLPLLIYFHGGGFLIESASSPTYHNYLNLLVAESNVVVVSVDYRLAPENPLPIAYEDSWGAVKWVAAHGNGGGQETWLKDHADLQRVFFGGDSAGGNIAHHMAIWVGSENLGGFHLSGIVLTHPFFWGKDPIGGESGENSHMKAFTDAVWMAAKPSSSGSDDPWLNPAKDPNVSAMGCKKVLVFVGEKDVLRDRGWHYQEVMGKSGWGGKVEVLESKGEEHVFFLFNPSSDNAIAMKKKINSFINESENKA